MCAAAGKPEPPARMLYSWYAPVLPGELKDAGVAWILAGITLDGDDAWPVPTAVGLHLPPGTFAMPVLRLNFRNDEGHKPRWTAKQREQVVRMIAEAVELTQAGAVQIDFDAPVSARAFYRQLLDDARRQLGPGVFLSMTALASWCDAGSWMKGLPVDEIVPLVFSMGPETASVQSRLSRGEKFGFEGCRASIGISAEGWQPPTAGYKRVYVFRGWR
jgi:hypothetical protein